MNSASALPVSISSPGKDRVVRAFGDEAIFHLETKHTGGPNMDRIVAISAEHGIHYV